jgi:hypothetical protein
MPLGAASKLMWHGRQSLLCGPGSLTCLRSHNHLLCLELPVLVALEQGIVRLVQNQVTRTSCTATFTISRLELIILQVKMCDGMERG